MQETITPSKTTWLPRGNRETGTGNKIRIVIPISVMGAALRAHSVRTSSQAKRQLLENSDKKKVSQRTITSLGQGRSKSLYNLIR